MSIQYQEGTRPRRRESTPLKTLHGGAHKTPSDDLPSVPVGQDVAITVERGKGDTHAHEGKVGSK